METRNELAKKYEYLIPLVLKNLHIDRVSDDYYDIGLIGLTNAINNYDASKNVKGETFAYTCIKNELMKSIHTENMQKRKYDGIFIPLDKEIQNSEGTFIGDLIADNRVNVEEEVSKNLLIEDLLKAIDKLRPEYRAVIKGLYGINQEEITTKEFAQSRGYTQGNVLQKKRRALKQLKKLLSNWGDDFDNNL